MQAADFFTRHLSYVRASDRDELRLTRTASLAHSVHVHLRGDKSRERTQIRPFGTVEFLAGYKQERGGDRRLGLTEPTSARRHPLSDVSVRRSTARPKPRNAAPRTILGTAILQY